MTNLSEIDLKTAFNRIRDEIRIDREYAWSWHCNIAMSAQDEGVDRESANKAASRFMDICFGVETKEPD